MILPKARYDWMHLKLQDFKSVSEYNSVLFKISSQLKLCGDNITEEDMLEKTFTTFHASNVLLQQQYRERRFIEYSQLISCLLVAEKNNELLMKNHQSRPTGSEAFPEVNAISSQNYERGRGRGRCRSRGRNSRQYNNSSSYHKRKAPFHHQKWNNNELRQENGESTKKKSKAPQDTCYRCGMEGHWSRTYRMTKHLVDLYQALSKENRKKIEMNFTNNNEMDLSYFDDDFLIGPSENFMDDLNDNVK